VNSILLTRTTHTAMISPDPPSCEATVEKAVNEQ
jgi:hypothetical protein